MSVMQAVRWKIDGNAAWTLPGHALLENFSLPQHQYCVHVAAGAAGEEGRYCEEYGRDSGSFHMERVRVTGALSSA